MAKLIVTDTGLGGRLIGLSEERAKDPTALVGPLLENFAIGEVARQLTWAEESVQLFHYRDRDKVEGDLAAVYAAAVLKGEQGLALGGGGEAYGPPQVDGVPLAAEDQGADPSQATFV